jgi:hypothetical protein
MTIGLYTVRGRFVEKNVTRFRIKWDGPSRSQPQFKAKQLLKAIWAYDIVFEEFPVYGTLLKVDIYNSTKQIAVEIQGPQHDKYNKFFHNGSKFNFVAGITRDLKKIEWLENNNIKLVEYIPKDLEDPESFYTRLYAD